MEVQGGSLVTVPISAPVEGGGAFAVEGGGIGEIHMTLEIVRADTGVKEIHNLIGKVKQQ